MHKLVSCYIKQKLRKCPYERLIQIENEIVYLKKARHYLKKQYEELTWQVEQMKSLHFNYKKKVYLDGFYWGNNEEDLERLLHLRCFSQETREHRQRCSFSNQDCELQLLAMRSMRCFLADRLMMEIQSYNTVLNIYESINSYHHKVDSSSTAFIRFSIEKDCSKAFYYHSNANSLVANAQYTIVCFEKKLHDKECHKYTIHFKIQEDGRVLTNTCLLNLGDRTMLIELCELMHWAEEGVPFKLKSLHELLSQMNITKSMSISLYGKLENLPTAEKIACMSYFRKEGFRVLGAFKENGHFEKECFMYYSL